MPSFTDFNETLKSSSNVTAEWILNCSGVFPLEQMTIRWREGANKSVNFPDENMATFNYDNSSTPANGALMQYQFQNLMPAIVYVVRIEGRNRLGNSSSHFVIETSKHSLLFLMKLLQYWCILVGDETTFTFPDEEGLAPNGGNMCNKVQMVYVSSVPV